MADIGTITIPIGSVCRAVTCKVVVQKSFGFSIRFKIGVLIMKIGAWIMPVKTCIQEGTGSTKECEEAIREQVFPILGNAHREEASEVQVVEE